MIGAPGCMQQSWPSTRSLSITIWSLWCKARLFFIVSCSISRALLSGERRAGTSGDAGVHASCLTRRPIGPDVTGVMCLSTHSGLDQLPSLVSGPSSGAAGVRSPSGWLWRSAKPAT
eukprot:9959034-Alexandrium_andersonii.AAC.1